MNRQAVAIVGMTMIVILGVFAVPTIINATEDPQTLETTLEPGMTEEVTNGLELAVNDSTNSEVDLTLIDTETDQEVRLMIAEGTTENYSLPGGDGSVTAVETTNQQATLEVEYDPVYGWSSAAVIFVDNLGLILMLLVMLVVVGAVKAVIK